MKTSELIGPALDWAVAKAKGLTVDNLLGGAVWAWTKDALTDEDETICVFNPSADWSQGGPIIERESITISPCEDMETWVAVATFKQGVEDQFGPTPLIAAMRCYVASKFGDEVEIPEELTC